MLVDAGLIVRRQLLLQQIGVLPNSVQNTALAIHPALFALAEQPVEEPVRDHLRRQRALVSGPAHVALHALAERFLRDADLQRAEPGVAADLGGDHLVDGRSARAAAGEMRAGHQPAHGVRVAVAHSLGGGVVHAAQHVEIAAERRERRKARRHRDSAAPSSDGIQYRSGMPFPLNHSTKRLSIALSAVRPAAAAYAVPCELNIETSGGSPTTICDPAAVSPFKMARRDSLTRFVITCDMNSPS